MRAEFEAWLRTVTTLARTRRGDGYLDNYVGLMWETWKASRAAIVVELPGTEGFGMYSEEVARVAIDCCADALQDAGIKWSRP